MSKRLTTEEFIERAKKVHGDKYDYSKVDYVNSKTNVCIVCPEHGEFWQQPNNHLMGRGCFLCGCKSASEINRSSVDEFVKKARKIHGNKYDYSEVEYVNHTTKVGILCSKHGLFWKTPKSHLRGDGCPKCSYDAMRLTTEGFIEKARVVHGDKYDYSNVDYVNNHTKVSIICPEHGIFEQLPTNHLRGNGCPRCVKVQSTDEFKVKASQVHDNKYNYDKVKYVNAKTDVCIICPVHGEFYQNAHSHLSGNGCPKCGSTCHYTTNEFVERAKRVHGDKYDYSKVDYVNNNTKVCIICLEHGEFWQQPNNHLFGKGCYKCGGSAKLTLDEFVDRANKVHACKYDYSKVNYSSLADRVCIICPEHGEFWQYAGNHLRGNGCPDCTISRSEGVLYSLLISEFGVDDVLRQYKSDEYPFKCDFYIKSRNMYIELNGTWTHSSGWFDSSMDSHLSLLSFWKEKSLCSNFYKSAIDIWTIRDVDKREIARKNNLNYVVFWDHTLEDAKKWFELGCPDGQDWDHEYSWMPK